MTTAELDAKLLAGLVSDLSVGSDHGITAAQLAAPGAGRPVALVAERLNDMEARGLVWKDARGYRRWLSH